MNLIVKGAAWLGLYIVLILFPLLVAAVVPGSAAARPFSLQFSVACGYVGLAIMVFEFALISRVKAASGAFGQDALLQFHRGMGLIALALVLLHPILIFANGYPLAWANPFAAATPWSIRWGIVALAMVLVLSAVSLFRGRLHIAYEWWQVSHMHFALIILFASLAHIFMVGSFSATRPMHILWTLYALIFLGLVFNFKLLKPLLMLKHPWEVVRNTANPGESHTLELRPVDHEGIRFQPGQFAWIMTGASPFHVDQHPISFSSCAYDLPGQLVAFTVKSLGNWSSSVVPALQPGQRLWLDGPYGVFSPDREQGPGYVLIGGGVGITPLHSMCLTLAEREDVRPVFLFYCNRDAESLTFRQHFDELQSRMNIHVIYVLEHPPEGETGCECGFISADILSRYLPKQYKRFQYFVCGPPAMMDAVEDILPTLGVPSELIHTERFDMV
jgi:predicted ferric reductase